MMPVSYHSPNLLLISLETMRLLVQNFLPMISVSLFYCWKKVFSHMNTWLIEKNSKKPYYLKKKSFFQLPKHGEYY